MRLLLEADGERVVAVDRVSRAADGYAQLPCDVTDPAAVDAVVAAHGVTAIVHCGGVSGPMVARDDPRVVVDANIGGTANLLEAARRHGVARVVYCSSIAAYGATPPGPVTESTPLRPLDVYGATKAAAEHLVAGYHHDHGVTGVSLRISTVFGARRRTACLIRGLLDDAAAGRPTRVRIPADAPQQYVHVDDVATAVRAALHAPGVAGAYNVSGGAVHTVAEVIAAVREADPRVRAAADPPDPVAAQGWPGALDLTAAAADLDWRPQRSLVDGVRAMVAELASGGR
ncbi:UDP-glucose 4-epimerase [Pseudonocardia sulfidoxydans NBRC 16205]|uniref:UDP-glucose 4-epimerase n=1 Tax=Pseudonocardia sulfidoxydans NBRC 16205 TaxID=1223511 RepID=A0A511DC45_9PSEU|nr:UDP-glucose 4-epimerase [Pseudonocardia sulfidoxydans NBRC 16205]